MKRFINLSLNRHSAQPLGRLLLHLSRLELGLALLVSLLLLGLTAQAAAARSSSSLGDRLGLPLSAALPESNQAGADPAMVADGAYLFGESKQPGELGKEYMVFEVTEGEMVGAFFSPSSDFSCFTGAIADEVMSLQVEDIETKTMNAFSVPLYLSNEVAAAEILFPFESALGLQGTYRIPELDAVSRQVLETCKAEF